MGERDFYSELGVYGEVDDVSLRRAFKRRSNEWDPEKHPGNDRIKKQYERLRAAYETLRDPDKRALYDEFGEVSLQPGFDPFLERERLEREKEREQARLAREEEKRRREKVAAERRAKAALVTPTALPLQDGRHGWTLKVAIGPRAARSGAVESLPVTRPETCPRCSGSGRKDVTCKRCKGEKKIGRVRLETCAPCHGVGILAEHGPCKSCGGTGVRRRRRCKYCQGHGRHVRRFDCASCHGRGFLVIRYDEACADCRGTGLAACVKCGGDGKVPVSRTLKLTVPRGVDANLEYRYAGAGFSPGPDGQPSDLFVRFVLLDKAPRRSGAARRRRRRW